MKIPVYYVVRVFKDGSACIDSGPHKTFEDACCSRDTNHHWGRERFNIMECFIEGEIV